jgi:hypothetical protein
MQNIMKHALICGSGIIFITCTFKPILCVAAILLLFSLVEDARTKMKGPHTSCVTEALANIRFCHLGIDFLKAGNYLNAPLSKAQHLYKVWDC